jgi:hypothetical protein
MTWTDRCFLAAASRLLARQLAVLHHHAETLRRWHRRRAHRRSMLAVDFFTVETIWLQRLCVLFFIELGSRPVHVAGSTPNPDILLEIGVNGRTGRVRRKDGGGARSVAEPALMPVRLIESLQKARAAFALYTVDGLQREVRTRRILGQGQFNGGPHSTRGESNGACHRLPQRNPPLLGLGVSAETYRTLGPR